MAHHFPICVDLRGRLCVVVGGGRVALRKVRALLSAQARVRVVALEIDAQIAERTDVECVTSAYDAALLRGATLVFAATDDAQINRQVHEDATERGLLVNVADTPELCSFIVPSVIASIEIDD